MTIWFDMDGTIADLYGVDGWLDSLRAADPTPYAVARPLVNLSRLARLLNKARLHGVKVGIISWTSKGGSDLYNGQVALAKMAWLHEHLPSVVWDSIQIVPYGTDKRTVCGGGILFDDEHGNRAAWGTGAYTPDEIFNILKEVVA